MPTETTPARGMPRGWNGSGGRKRPWSTGLRWSTSGGTKGPVCQLNGLNVRGVNRRPEETAYRQTTSSWKKPSVRRGKVWWWGMGLGGVCEAETVFKRSRRQVVTHVRQNVSLPGTVETYQPCQMGKRLVRRGTRWWSRRWGQWEYVHVAGDR